MSDLQQNLMDEVYNKWNTEECKEMDRLEVINNFFTLKHKIAVQLGNMNYQVNNGGWTQWHDNGYSEDLKDLIEISKKGIKLGLKTFNPLLQILINIEKLGKAKDCDYVEHHTCYECNGDGVLTEYDEDDNEIETTCPECCGVGWWDEDVEGEGEYGELLSKFDKEYYAIGESELLKDFEMLLENINIDDKDDCYYKFYSETNEEGDMIGAGIIRRILKPNSKIELSLSSLDDDTTNKN